MYTADDTALERAVEVLEDELAAIDAACSRFRADSEISLLHERAGRPVRVSRLLARALAVSLDAARATDGLVDPTVGAAVRGLGYDSDFASVAADSDQEPPEPVAAPGWWRVALDEQERFALLPKGIDLDLGATAKALAADLAAVQISTDTGCGVLVNLGGDLRVSGPAPAGGWLLRVCEDHAAAPEQAGPMVSVESGAVATSSTTVRSWRRAGRQLHHVVDPRTGDVAAAVWRTVTVAAATCVEANTATTAALVLGHDAPGWLEGLGLPSRLVATDGAVLTLGGWPADETPGDTR